MADSPPRRYLDNAATSWPKPDAVIAAWNDAAIRVGATASIRGASHCPAAARWP
jgi:hypothetical protein